MHDYGARASILVVRGTDGGFTSVEASQRTPEPGTWMLGLRPTQQGNRMVNQAVVIVPVLRLVVSPNGTLSNQVYEVTPWLAACVAPWPCRQSLRPRTGGFQFC